MTSPAPAPAESSPMSPVEREIFNVWETVVRTPRRPPDALKSAARLAQALFIRAAWDAPDQALPLLGYLMSAGPIVALRSESSPAAVQNAQRLSLDLWAMVGRGWMSDAESCAAGHCALLWRGAGAGLEAVVEHMRPLSTALTAKGITSMPRPAALRHAAESHDGPDQERVDRVVRAVYCQAAVLDATARSLSKAVYEITRRSRERSPSRSALAQTLRSAHTQWTAAHAVVLADRRASALSKTPRALSASRVAALDRVILVGQTVSDGRSPAVKTPRRM